MPGISTWNRNAPQKFNRLQKSRIFLTLHAWKSFVYVYLRFPRQATIRFFHLYLWEERSAERVKCLPLNIRYQWSSEYYVHISTYLAVSTLKIKQSYVSSISFSRLFWPVFKMAADRESFFGPATILEKSDRETLGTKLVSFSSLHMDVTQRPSPPLPLKEISYWGSVGWYPEERMLSHASNHTRRGSIF